MGRTDRHTFQLIVRIGPECQFFEGPECYLDACPAGSYSLIGRAHSVVRMLVSDSLLSRVQITARILVLLSQIPFFPESKLQPGCLSSCLRFPSFQSPNYSQDSCPPVLDSLLSRVQVTPRILVLLSEIPFFP